MRKQVTSFLATTFMLTSLCSCSNSVMIYLSTPNENITVLTKKEYEKIMNVTNDGWRNDIYDALLDVLFEYEFDYEKSAGHSNGVDLRTYNQVKTEADEMLKAIKQLARDNAQEKGTGFEEEMKLIFEQYHCSNEDELYKVLLRKSKVDAMKHWYLYSFENDVLEEFVYQYLPYHSRHIYFGIADDGYDYENGGYGNTSVSSEEINSFCDYVNAFAVNGKMFYELANPSQDYGDTGIMTINTSFIDEYKMGVYSFDAVYSGMVSEDDAKSSNIGLYNTITNYSNVTIYDKIQEWGLHYVPYGAVQKMLEVKDDEDVEDDRNPQLFPRNIYFNKYINRRTPFVISNNGFDTNSSIRKDLTGDDITHSDVDSSIAPAQEGKSGFRHVEGICKDPAQMILTDETGAPIFCVRSIYGIHFINILKSPFEDDVKDYFEYTDLEKKGTYIEGPIISTNPHYHSDRASHIINYIYESVNYPHFEYRIFKYFLENEKDIKFIFKDNSIDFLQEIDIMIESSIWRNYEEKAEYLKADWMNYIDKIQNIEEKRHNGMLIPEPLD